MRVHGFLIGLLVHFGQDNENVALPDPGVSKGGCSQSHQWGMVDTSGHNSCQISNGSKLTRFAMQNRYKTDMVLGTELSFHSIFLSIPWIENMPFSTCIAYTTCPCSPFRKPSDTFLPRSVFSYAWASTSVTRWWYGILAMGSGETGYWTCSFSLVATPSGSKKIMGGLEMMQIELDYNNFEYCPLYKISL
jgi:hypothetical protein